VSGKLHSVRHTGQGQSKLSLFNAKAAQASPNTAHALCGIERVNLGLCCAVLLVE